MTHSAAGASPSDRIAAVRLRRRQLRDLAQRLMVEYAGAVSPGRVLALVHQADRADRPHRPAGEPRVDRVEQAVRRMLAHEIVSAGRRAVPQA